jgi:fructokinase
MKPSKISSIVVFGEALADEFPEQKIIGGAPFNVARALAHFGCAPLMISRIGQDAIGELIQADMHRCGMSTLGLQIDAARSSGRVVVTQNNPEDNSSHQFEILPDQAYDYIEQTTTQQAVAAYCQNHPAGLIYFGTLAQRSVTSRLSLNTLLKEEKSLKYLDLNLRDGQVTAATIDDSLCRADIVKLNEDELCYLLDQYSGNTCATLDPNADRLSWKPPIDGLMKQFDLLAIIVTLGARGYAYFDVEGQFFSADQMLTLAVIVDTVGGGDAFSAVFLTGLYQGWPLPTSLRRAHEFATAVCGIRGAVSSDPNFYQSWMQRWAEEDQLKEA